MFALKNIDVCNLAMNEHLQVARFVVTYFRFSQWHIRGSIGEMMLGIRCDNEAVPICDFPRFLIFQREIGVPTFRNEFPRGGDTHFFSESLPTILKNDEWLISLSSLRLRRGNLSDATQAR